MFRQRLNFSLEYGVTERRLRWTDSLPFKRLPTDKSLPAWPRQSNGDGGPAVGQLVSSVGLMVAFVIERTV